MNTPRNDTDFLRCVAILLIINSHLDRYYPLPIMATGGAIGNAFFFMLSSFGLFLSEQKKQRPLSEWYVRRLSRIYPSVWVALILLYIPMNFLIGNFTVKNTLDIFGHFFYPPFWFLQAILIYYLAIFFIIRDFSRKKLWISIAVPSLAYLYFYTYHIDLNKFSVEHLPFKLLISFIFMLIGIHFASINEKIKYSGPMDYCLFLGSLIIIYINKYMMTHGIGFKFQIVQQLFLIPLMYYGLKISRSQFIMNTIMTLPIISTVILFISTLTLELYIAHGMISFFFKFYEIIFPLNIVAYVATSIVFAVILKKTAELMTRFA